MNKTARTAFLSTLLPLALLSPLQAIAQSQSYNYGTPPAQSQSYNAPYGPAPTYPSDPGHEYGAFQDSARVTHVVPRYERIVVPQQYCRNEIERTDTYSSAPYPRERSMAGSVVGGIAGAIIGNQVGRGSGRTVATAAGAIGGAIVGDRISNGNGYDNGYPQAGVPVERQVRRCSVSNRTEERIAGYDVTYQYQGRSYTSFMQNAPGDMLRVNVAVTPLY